MTNTIRRAFSAAAIAAIALAGSVVPAHAGTTPDCDPVAIDTGLDAASADAREAQKAFTTYAKTSVQALVKQIRTTESREAKAADRKADQLERKAAKLSGKQSKEARAAAKAARAVARAEAKEAAKVQRASDAQLRAIIKTERDRLKAEWDAAKDALQELEAEAEDCADAPVVEEPTGDDPVVDPAGQRLR